MKTRVGVLAVLAFSVAVAGCSGGGQGDPVAAVTSVSSASPTEWPREQAGQEYLRIVGPFNAVMDESRKLPQSTNLETYRPLCKRAVTMLDQQMRDLDAGAWPSDARSAVDDLIAESAELRGWFAGCVAAESMEDMSGSLQPQSRGAGAVVRVKLGLPPASVGTPGSATSMP